MSGEQAGKIESVFYGDDEVRGLAAIVVAALVMAGAGPVRSGLSAPTKAVIDGGDACPTTLSASTRLPAHSRVTGKTSARPLALNDASISLNDAETVNPVDELNESEPDSTNAVRNIYRYNRESATALVCRYGAIKPPMLADAVLVTRLTRPIGTCIFTHRRSGRPAAMVCHEGLDR